MASKTKSTKSKKDKTKSLNIPNNTPKPSYLKVIIVAVLAILLVWLAFFRADQRYGVSIDDVKNRIQSTLETVQLPGEQLASNTTDRGCSSGSSVGLSTRIECSMEGYKYFDVSEDKKTALSQASAKFESLGFKKDVNNSYFDQVINGTVEGDVNYSKEYTTVQIGWSSWPTDVNGPVSTTIADALSSHRIGVPAAGATIAGVTVKEVYWTCSSSGLDIFGISCIFPPHSLNK